MWTHAGVGVAAGYIPTVPRPGVTRWSVLCATVDFVRLEPGQVVQTPPTQTGSAGQPTMYTVVPGDTLSGIAQRFHVAGGWQALYQRNRDKIADPNLIFPGQVLVIR
jgi:LysM repeat protein